MEAERTNSGGIGFAGVLTVLFVGLKLTHFIDWSWWWVISPTLIVFGLAVIIGVVAGLIAGPRRS